VRARLGRQGRQGDKGGKPDKINHKLSILWIKSSLSTILPCLPGLAFIENIKNLHLSAGEQGREELKFFPITCQNKFDELSNGIELITQLIFLFPVPCSLSQRVNLILSDYLLD
jgi:hypothetical protein